MNKFTIIETTIDKKIITNKKKKKQNITLLFLFILLVFFINKIGLGIANGSSMEPTINDNDLIIYYKSNKVIKKGDIVIVKLDNKVVKRIEDIKNNKVFLVGDNINNSYDSRKYGEVECSKILGKVIYVINR